jgi:hypothetical protein
MRGSPKTPGPKEQPSSVSTQSESVKPKRVAGLSHSVKFAGKPTKDLRFFRLAVQLSELFDFATSDKQGLEKRAAGRMLAQLYLKSHKLHSKLRTVNAAYNAEITELQNAGSRADVLFPKSYVGQVLQEELKKAERYQFKLQLCRELLDDQPPLQLLTLDREAIRKRKPINKHLPNHIHRDEIVESVRLTWQAMARKSKIPEDYWSTTDLPRFCAKSERRWWKFIWSRLNQRQAELLPQLRESAKQRAEAKTNPIYLKHFYKQFRQHWEALIRAREAGFF